MERSRMKRIKTRVIARQSASLLWRLIPVILSADLLYLCYDGAWSDPYMAILVAEIAGLLAISGVGLISFADRLREVCHGKS